MKKFLSFSLSVLLMLSLLVVSANAAVANPDSLLWDAMGAVEVSVTFVGNNGMAIANISGIHGITNQLDAIMIVYQEVDGELIYIDSTGGSAETALRLRVDFDAESGATYVAEVIVTAYSSEGSETETISDTNTCP